MHDTGRFNIFRMFRVPVPEEMLDQYGREEIKYRKEEIQPLADRAVSLFCTLYNTHVLFLFNKKLK